MRPSIEGVRELQFEGFLLHAPDTVGEVSTQEWQGTFRAAFNNGAYTDDDITDVFTQRITTPFHIYKNVFIPNGLYHFARHQLTYGSGQDRRFTYNFFERFGGYYGGTLNEFRVLLPAASCVGLDTIQCRQDAGATCVTTLCGEEES